MRKFLMVFKWSHWFVFQTTMCNTCRNQLIRSFLSLMQSDKRLHVLAVYLDLLRAREEVRDSLRTNKEQNCSCLYFKNKDIMEECQEITTLVPYRTFKLLVL